MSITVFLLSVILGSAALVSQTGAKTASQAELETRVQTRARRVLDRVAQQLNGAAQAQIAPDPGAVGASSFSFRTVDSVSNAGVIAWSNTRRFDLLPDTGDADDGVDNDGDGGVDEKRLVFTLDAGLASQKQVTLAHDVRELMANELPNGLDDDGDGLADEPGFLVTRSGNLLTLRVTIEKFLADGRSAATTFQTAILLRN
jgi:hypothetical protein